MSSAPHMSAASTRAGKDSSYLAGLPGVPSSITSGVSISSSLRVYGAAKLPPGELTALHVAAERGSAELIRVLVAAGAKVRRRHVLLCMVCCWSTKGRASQRLPPVHAGGGGRKGGAVHNRVSNGRMGEVVMHFTREGARGHRTGHPPSFEGHGTGSGSTARIRMLVAAAAEVVTWCHGPGLVSLGVGGGAHQQSVTPLREVRRVSMLYITACAGCAGRRAQRTRSHLARNALPALPLPSGQRAG